MLSKDELIKGYTQLYGSVDRATLEVENILDKVDFNKNGSIDYSGKPVTDGNQCRIPDSQHSNQ